MCLWMTIVWVTINDLAYRATTGVKYVIRICCHDVLLGFFYAAEGLLSIDRARGTPALMYPTLSKLYTIPPSATWTFRSRAPLWQTVFFRVARLHLDSRTQAPTSESPH